MASYQNSYDHTTVYEYRDSPITINENHTVPSTPPYKIYLAERPSSVSGSQPDVSAHTITTDFEIGEDEFRVDYETGSIDFSSHSSGDSVTVNYTGMGSIIRASAINDIGGSLSKVLDFTQALNNNIVWMESAAYFAYNSGVLHMSSGVHVELFHKPSGASPKYTFAEQGFPLSRGEGIVFKYDTNREPTVTVETLSTSDPTFDPSIGEYFFVLAYRIYEESSGYGKVLLWNGVTLANEGLYTGVASGGGSGGGSFTLEFGSGDLDNGVLAVSHGLGRKYVNVSLYDDNEEQIANPDRVIAVDESTCHIYLNSFLVEGSWHVSIS